MTEDEIRAAAWRLSDPVEAAFYPSWVVFGWQVIRFPFAYAELRIRAAFHRRPSTPGEPQ